MSDERASEVAKQEIESLKLNITALEKFRVPNVTAATVPIVHKVVFKLLVYRESLLWRTLELASGAVLELENSNALSGIIIARSVQECAASCHYYSKKLEQCIRDDSANGLDDHAMKFLLGSRWSDWEHSSVNILTAIDKADKALPGFRSSYDNLSEYCHPNYSGVAFCFSRRNGKYDVRFGSYPRGLEEHLLTATRSLVCSLALFQQDYNSSAALLENVTRICARDLEPNL